MIMAFINWGRNDGFGWDQANRVFRPTGSFLHYEDMAMDWLYKLRAAIGAALLIIAGVHYHQAFKDYSSSFNPVLGGIGGLWGPLVLGLMAVIPATALVVLCTKEGRDEVFWQMMRYPVKTALISLLIYQAFRGADRVLKPLIADSLTADFIIGIGGGILALRYCMFLFRGIYLVTVGICRVGDGHPLLPPIVGSLITWIAVIPGLKTSPTAGEPATVWLAALLAAPISVTLLGFIEAARLQKRFPGDFPFRKGPLPLPQADVGGAPDESAHSSP